MAGSVNKVILVGNLGRDPEVRHTQDGKPIVNLASPPPNPGATSQRRAQGKDRVAPRRDLQRSLAKVAEQYLKKGSTVYIEGQLQTRKYTDQSGVEKFSTEVVLQNYRGELTMLGGRPGSEGGSSFGGGGDEFGQSSPMDRPRSAGAKPQSFARDLDDEVPF